jgi:hypothetical protein
MRPINIFQIALNKALSVLSTETFQLLRMAIQEIVASKLTRLDRNSSTTAEAGGQGVCAFLAV